VRAKVKASTAKVLNACEVSRRRGHWSIRSSLALRMERIDRHLLVLEALEDLRQAGSGEHTVNTGTRAEQLDLRARDERRLLQSQELPQPEAVDVGHLIEVQQDLLAPSVEVPPHRV